MEFGDPLLNQNFKIPVGHKITIFGDLNLPVCSHEQCNALNQHETEFHESSSLGWTEFKVSWTNSFKIGSSFLPTPVTRIIRVNCDAERFLYPYCVESFVERKFYGNSKHNAWKCEIRHLFFHFHPQRCEIFVRIVFPRGSLFVDASEAINRARESNHARAGSVVKSLTPRHGSRYKFI